MIKVILLSSIFLFSCTSEDIVYNSTPEEITRVKEGVKDKCYNSLKDDNDFKDLTSETTESFKDYERGDRWEAVYFRTDPDLNDGNEEETLKFTFTVLKATDQEIYIHILRSNEATTPDTTIPLQSILVSSNSIIKFSTANNSCYIDIFKYIKCDSEVSSSISSSNASFNRTNFELDTNTNIDFQFNIKGNIPAILELAQRVRTKEVDTSNNNETTTRRVDFKQISTDSTLDNSDILTLYNNSSSSLYAFRTESFKSSCNTTGTTYTTFEHFRNTTPNWLTLSNFSSDELIN